MQKRMLIPAIALAAGLLFSLSAQAQPFRPGPGPGPGFRPGPPIIRPGPGPIVGLGIGIRAAPGIGIGIRLGGPVLPPPRPPVVVVDPIPYSYRVLYRDRLNEPWQVYQAYESHRVAHDVAEQLRDMGYQARVLHD
jgi:hypothetical protein